MSSPFDNDEVARTGDHELRSVSGSKLSAARRIGDFVRGLWSSAETPESPPAGYEVALGEEVELDENPAPGSAAIPDSAATPDRAAVGCLLRLQQYIDLAKAGGAPTVMADAASRVLAKISRSRWASASV